MLLDLLCHVGVEVELVAALNSAVGSTTLNQAPPNSPHRTPAIALNRSSIL